ncbi:hypothetical protein DFR50_10945 [Roseiarcus fermentans]|uniref:Uncharacterized protein n=1 Tax=Roseiarcus fermentans TaxID=1473586 RepID=A0A366FI10_9HYPH|nr:hypothetical protein [Roseiarcus fermentans]RBP14292.1 hypothetical protein DFR50_10945 [Roseiarcus fermentans]
MVTRRAALALFSGLLASALAPDFAQASSWLRVSRIHVDVSRLRRRRGDPTAQWVADAMPASVAQALGRRFARGAPGGAVLNVDIDDVHLLPMRMGEAPRIVDEITGFVSLAGPGVAPRRRSLRATAVFRPAARDMPMRVEANRRRVTLLVERFAAQIPRDLGL